MSAPFVLPDQLDTGATLATARAFYAATVARWLAFMEGTVAISGTLDERRVLVRSFAQALLEVGLVRAVDLDELVAAHVLEHGNDAEGLAAALAYGWCRGR